MQPTRFRQLVGKILISSVDIRGKPRKFSSTHNVYDTIRYDTIEEFNADLKAEYTA